MGLSQKHKYRPVEQVGSHTHTPMGTLSLTKEARIYNGEMIISSISCAGRSGQLHVREWD